MSHQFPDSPRIQPWLIDRTPVNFGKVIAQSVGTREVESPGRPVLPYSLQILKIAFAGGVIGQKTEFSDTSKRSQASAAVETGHIQGSDMSGKTVESTVFPQQDLRPVGHVFVTEGSAVHRVNHGAASLLFGRRIIDPDRSAV